MRLEEYLIFNVEYLLAHLKAKPPIESLKAQVDAAMALFAEAEEKEKREAERIRNMPDEDGFVTVTRGKGRRTNMDGQGASVMPLRTEDAQQLKPKDHTLVDFYRFQKREQKRNELAELRRKFDQDKQKIAALKEKRKFKPY